MRVLFLDDNENRHTVFKKKSIGCSVDHVYTSAEAIKKLNNEEINYDIIFLDHDLNWQTENELNENEEDGRTVAKHLVSIEKYKSSPIIIHSLNNSGGLYMKGILEGGGYTKVFYKPFAWKNFSKNYKEEWNIM